MSKKLTQEEFLERVKEVHCDTYRYDKTVVNGSKIPVTITCPIHGDFEQRPGDHLRGFGCPLCGIEKSRKAKRNTTEEFIEKAKKVHGNKYDYSKVEYIDKLTPVIIICPIHGEFTQTPDTHLNGSGCQKCGVEKSKQTVASQKLTTEKFIEKARKIHGDKYDYSKVEYVNSHTPVKIICKIHGEFEQSPTNHLCGKGCPICGGKNMTTEKFIEKARLIHGDKYDYSKVNYVNNRTKVCIICPEHGEFWQTPNSHLSGKGCLRCGVLKQTEKRTDDYQNFVEKSRMVHGDKYDYSNVEYINAHVPVSIMCKKHGIFKQIPYVHLAGCGCQLCNNGISRPEKEITDFICNLIGESNVITNTRKFLDGQEIDIYLPQLKIGIEYDGLYWHSEANEKDKNYHLKKTELTESKGIRLIHIFEDEWREHKEIVLNKIKHIIGKDNSIVVGARKCRINLINKELAKTFLDKYHIQGYVSSTIYLGAYYNNELVGVMTFLKEKDMVWNLTRFATNFKYRLPGLANKLFNSFIIDNNPQIVKSFLDRRWGTCNDNVYNKLGFHLDGVQKPDYSYVKGHSRYHKFNFRKQTLSKKYNLPLSMTEKEMCDKLGYFRIWNCGLYKYVWKNSQQN